MIQTVTHKKAILIILMLFLQTAFGFVAEAEAGQLLKSLPLECHKIPNKKDQLCYIETEADYGPYDDIVLYRVNSRDYATFLGSQSGGVATFGGFDFSTGGTYMWLEWAEEGHPHYEFYRTADFLGNGTSAKILSILGDYYFDGFEEFTDAGKVVYRLADEAYEDCSKAGKGVSYKINPKTSEKYCIKKFNLHIP